MPKIVADGFLIFNRRVSLLLLLLLLGRYSVLLYCVRLYIAYINCIEL